MENIILLKNSIVAILVFMALDWNSRTRKNAIFQNENPDELAPY